MSVSRATIRRRRAVGLATVLGLCGAVGVLLTGGGDRADGQEGGPVRVEAELGAVRAAGLLVSAPRGRTGDPQEAWGIGELKHRVVADGRTLEPAPVALMRYTQAEGWRWIDTAVDAAGTPYDGAFSGVLAGSTPEGGLALMARSGPTVSLLHRPPGGRLTAVAAPGPDVLLPAAGSVPAEQLSSTLVAALAEGDATVAYVPVSGRTRTDAVARFDGKDPAAAGGWTREPVCVAADAAGTPPAGCSAAETLAGSRERLEIRSISAADGHAWLLADAADAADRGLVLFERVTDGGTPRWRYRDLAHPFFDGQSAAVLDIESRPGRTAAAAATAAGDGVWLDAQVLTDVRRWDATVHVAADGSVETWCDTGTSLCDHGFGIGFTETTRSFAWDGPGGRRRVLTTLAEGVGRAVLEGDAFTRRQLPVGSAAATFASPDEGWMGDQHVTRAAPQPVRTSAWPLSVRRPLTAIATAPGKPVGELSSGALAVGLGGAVVRYTPGQGWDTEFLQGSSGVSSADLRGVAWPAPSRAHAVGEDGAMWRWRAATGLWEPDPGAPYDFVGQLTGIAFQPGDPERGYAVGRDGVILAYGKSWEPEPLPAELRGQGQLGHDPDITSIAFAGSQALAVARSDKQAWLLVNDGSGWRVDTDASALGGAGLRTVAGLPDGGAVAAGREIVITRDGVGAAWRATDQPLSRLTAVVAAPFRDGGRVRAVVAAADADLHPGDSETLPIPVPGAPQPLTPSAGLAPEGYVLRETAAGWRDEQRTAVRSPTHDKPYKSDPVLAMALNPAGDGWLVGGAANATDSAGRGFSQNSEAVTAYVGRYAASGELPAAPGARATGVPLTSGAMTLVAGGHPQCQQDCAQLEAFGLLPDRLLATALSVSAGLAGRDGGPRAFLSTGGRIRPGAVSATQALPELQRYAALLSGGGALPTYSAASEGELTGGAASWAQALNGLPQPLGGAAAPSPRAGVAVTPLPDQPATGARTSYAFDSRGPEGTVRVVVIDNAGGSLAAGDASGNPDRRPEGGQLAWLDRVLAEAQTARVPAVVVGSRGLAPGAGAAQDGPAVADLLRRRNVAAYLYDGNEASRIGSVPPGAADGVPAIATGTLGYRAQVDPNQYSSPGFVLLEVGRVPRGGGRPPVRPRLIPVIEDLAIEAVDGRLLDRSQPALFQGLGRRPRAGDRWEVDLANGTANLQGSSPYVALPTGPCEGGGCGDRLTPEVRFTSSKPTVADFVRQDPNSTNPRRPLLDPATDKPIADATSGLMCAFNEGTTTITVEAGGLSYSTTVTVRPGSVLRPCGTVPRDPSEFPPPETDTTTPPGVDKPLPPEATPTEDEPAEAIPPPPPPPVPTPPAPEPTPETPHTPEPLQPQFLTPPSQAVAPPVIVPPLIPLAQPIPPSGTAPVTVVQPVAQTATKEQREDEEAIETQSAFAKYEPDAGPPVVPVGIGAVIAIALLGYGVGQTRFRARARFAEARAVRTRGRL